ncbi:MAG: restriction endonuclease subunit S [Pseudomonadota bacterium]
MNNKVAETRAKYFVKDGVAVVGGMNSELQKVPRGYIQSEVGIVPADWQVLDISQFSKTGSGTTPSRAQEERYFRNGETHWVKTTDLNNSVVANTEDMVTDLAVKETCLQVYPIGTVLVAMYGGFNQIGRTGLLSIPAAVNQALVAVQVNKHVDSRYLLNMLNYKVEYWKSVASSSRKDPNITSSDVKNFKLALPKLRQEQTAIANALSDVDALITSLEKLIAKKRAIKTATMQQLLTGKKRLPPFDILNNKDGTPRYKQTEVGEIPEDWDVVGLGFLFESNINRRRLSGQDDVTFVGMQDVTEGARIASSHKIKYAEIKSGFTYFEKNDVLVAKITPCFENGKGGYADVIATQVGFGSTEFHVLRAKAGVDSKYLYYFTNTTRFRSELEGEMVGSAGHRRVPFSSLQKYRITVTLNPREQSAIANVLSDIDKEIDALENRLSKTQQLKQGMMQELLTGRTRLL